MTVALLWPYGAARSVRSAAPKLERVPTMGPIYLRTSIVFDHFPWTMFSQSQLHRVLIAHNGLLAASSAHSFDVPADSRVAWAWLHDVPTHVYGTVHPPLKSIAVVYEYAFPLLLANKHDPFFFSL
jgi:hypothetical protein